MGKRAPIWIDGYETKTAADVETPEACDAYKERLIKNVQHIIDGMELPIGIPRNAKKLLALQKLPSYFDTIPEELRNAIFYKKIGLIQLRDRKRELLAQTEARTSS